MKFLLATRNRGKLEELQVVLEELSVELISLETLEGAPDVEEDGATFAENARKKALHYLALTGLPSIADDSGLEVDALGGRPGVYSARYAATDAARMEKLLGELRDRGVSGAGRSARFVCAICLAFGNEDRIEVEGRVEGFIAEAPRGDQGFGYDPVFYYPPFGATFGEVPGQKKNLVSHRAAALTRLKQHLKLWPRSFLS